ncbi:MAG TPA: hypothetical protein VHS75_11185 [Phenylobacterium sp.]|nr:hypothetical protein [Phenylobacterium sp.]
MASVAVAETPPLVAAYNQQLVRQCGGDMTPALATQVVQQIDLNGDKIDDWIIDAGRYPCPNRAAAFKDAGSQVTVFLGRADGRALPAFQRIAYGSRIEGKPATGYALWLTLGGSDCGEGDPKARCDRRLTWQTVEQRFELVDPAAKPPTSTLPPKKK